jgi:hypothetical protein
MKNITFKVMALAAALCCGGNAMASDFGLQGLDADGVRGMQGMKAAPVSGADADDTIGVDAAIRIPYKTMKKGMLLMTEANRQITIIDGAAPILVRSGEFMQILNIRVNLNGIIAEPVITLKPYLEGRDKLAIKIQKIQLHISMAPTPGRSSAQTPIAAPVAGAEADFDKEQMMADVMKAMTDGITGALNESLVANASPLRAADIVNFKYDKAAWILHTRVSTAAIKRYLPGGFMGDLHLIGLTFNDKAISLKFKTDN